MKVPLRLQVGVISISYIQDNEPKIRLLLEDLKHEGCANEMCFVTLQHFRDLHLTLDTLDCERPLRQ